MRDRSRTSALLTTLTVFFRGLGQAEPPLRLGLVERLYLRVERDLRGRVTFGRLSAVPIRIPLRGLPLHQGCDPPATSERTKLCRFDSFNSGRIPGAIHGARKPKRAALEGTGHVRPSSIHCRRNGLRTNNAKSPVRTFIPITTAKTGIQLPVASKTLAATGAPRIDPTPCAT